LLLWLLWRQGPAFSPSWPGPPASQFMLYKTVAGWQVCLTTSSFFLLRCRSHRFFFFFALACL
jgi:hypothetical protein